MPAADIEKAKGETAALARRYPSVPQTEFMHLFRTARSIVGSTEEGEKALEMLAPLRVMMGSKEGATDDLDKVLKSAEITGATQDHPRFKRDIDYIAKALNVFPESTLRPVDYFETAKYSRAAAAGLSDKFLYGVGPTLAAEMGGMSTGSAIQAFNRAIVGKHMSHEALRSLADIGLIKEEDMEKTTTGSIKGILPGREIKGSRLAQENPYEWTKQILLPALKEHGITEKPAILAKISELFSKQTAAQLVGMFATQSPRIEKDIKLMEKAKGAEESAQILQAKDLNTQITAAKNVVGDLAGTLGTDLLTNTGALNAVTDGLARLNERMTNIVPGSGQEKFNRGMNKIFPTGGPGQGGAPIIVPGGASRLVKARAGSEAARRAYMATSWRHPLDKLEAQRTMGNAIQKELEAKEKFEAGRAPVSLGMHAGQRHLLGPAGAAGPAAELKGQATITNRLSISLDPGLIAKEVRSQLDAGGNLRADTGVSMPSSALPR